MGYIVKCLAVAVVLFALLGVAACGDELTKKRQRDTKAQDDVGSTPDDPTAPAGFEKVPLPPTDPSGSSSSPADRGLAPTPTFPKDFMGVRVLLTVEAAEDDKRAYTRIRVDGSKQVVDLPTGWRGHAAESAARREAHPAKLTEVGRQIRLQIKAQGGDASSLRGRIEVPESSRATVPHIDVLHVLIALLAEGIPKVELLDGPDPSPRATEVLLDLSREGSLQIGSRSIPVSSDSPADSTALAKELRTAFKRVHADGGVPWPPTSGKAPPVHLRTEWGTPAETILRLIEALRHEPFRSYRLRFSFKRT